MKGMNYMKTFLRILWLVSGILLIVCGAYVLLHPAQTLMSIASLIGIVTLFSGAFSLATYFTQKDEIFGAKGILLDGILDVILGVLLIIYPTSSLIANLFLGLMSIWVISKGATAIYHAILAKEFERYWYVLLIIGILLLLFGILALFKPIITMVAISVILGVFLISDGIEILGHWWMIQRFRKNLGL